MLQRESDQNDDPSAITDPGPNRFLQMSRRLILQLASLTLLLFGGGGLLLTAHVRPVNLMDFLLGYEPLWRQVLVGLSFGLICARGSWEIVQLPFMKGSHRLFAGIIAPMRLNMLEILFISVCAGIGEELLFRGGLQPLLGIWPTSILFVLLHGYLNPFNLPLSAYGVYMILVIGVMGLLTEHMGIGTAIAAHVVVDVYLLYQLSGKPMGDDHPGENRK